MALKLLTKHAGVDANYWRILKYEAVIDAGTTLVTVGLYASADIRGDGAGFILERHTYRIDGVDLARAEMYAALKALPEFTDSEDLL